MGNEGVIILVVVAGAIGLAYFSNMLCQPSGNTLCWPPSAVAQEPAEEVNPETGEVPEATRGFLPTFTEAISKTIGGSSALLPPIAAPKPGGTFADIFEAERRRTRGQFSGKVPEYGAKPIPKRLYSKLTGFLTPKQQTGICKSTRGPSYCWSEGSGKCVPCGSTAAKMGAVDYANFAEAEGYYVRVA